MQLKSINLSRFRISNSNENLINKMGNCGILQNKNVENEFEAVIQISLRISHLKL